VASRTDDLEDAEARMMIEEHFQEAQLRLEIEQQAGGGEERGAGGGDAADGGDLRDPVDVNPEDDFNEDANRKV
jgi:hypothetical protein